MSEIVIDIEELCQSAHLRLDDEDKTDIKGEIVEFLDFVSRLDKYDKGSCEEDMRTAALSELRSDVCEEDALCAQRLRSDIRVKDGYFVAPAMFSEACDE